MRAPRCTCNDLGAAQRLQSAAMKAADWGLTPGDLACAQASIGALPRLHPGLLVARAQAADLAGRLQAHAQVGSSNGFGSCCSHIDGL
jgi:hypothetical protein